MDCKACKHNLVCKYKEEYTRVRQELNTEKFKGIFDMRCNEYLESVNLADTIMGKQIKCPICNNDILDIELSSTGITYATCVKCDHDDYIFAFIHEFK